MAQPGASGSTNPRYFQDTNWPDQLTTKMTLDPAWPTTLNLQGPQPEGIGINSVSYGRNNLKVKLWNLRGSLSDYKIILYVEGIISCGGRIWGPVTQDPNIPPKRYKSWFSEAIVGPNGIEFVPDNSDPFSVSFVPMIDVCIRSAENWHDFFRHAPLPYNNLAENVPTGLTFRIELRKKANSFPKDSWLFSPDPELMHLHHLALIDVTLEQRQVRFIAGPTSNFPRAGFAQRINRGGVSQAGSPTSARNAAGFGTLSLPVRERREEKLPNINQAMVPPTALSYIPEQPPRKPANPNRGQKPG